MKLKTSDRWVIKSGTDFREFSYISLNISSHEADDKKSHLDVLGIEKYIIDSEVQEDEEIKKIVNSYLGKLKEIKRF